MDPHGAQVLRHAALLICQNVSGKKIQRGRDSAGGDKCDPEAQEVLPHSVLLPEGELKAAPSPALTELVESTSKSLYQDNCTAVPNFPHYDSTAR